MTRLDIYFAASISGGRQDASIYAEILQLLREYGTVLSEHLGDPQLNLLGDVTLDDRFVHDRDVAWLDRADVLVAEVTQPSIGTGYEIGRAVIAGKPTLCLYREADGRRLSQMISGSSAITVRRYTEIGDLPAILSEFFDQITRNRSPV